jgi:predicted DNA-binding transcriptional regulator AlpA
MDLFPIATSAQGPATTSIAKPVRLLRAEEVSEILGVPVATLKAWGQRGQGPRALLTGKHARRAPAELEDWMTTRTRDAVMAEQRAAA